MIEKGQKQNVDKSAAKFSDKYFKMTEKKKVFLMPKMEKKNQSLKQNLIKRLTFIAD